jgi:hypothetical protein
VTVTVDGVHDEESPALRIRAKYSTTALYSQGRAPPSHSLLTSDRVPDTMTTTMGTGTGTTIRTTRGLHAGTTTTTTPGAVRTTRERWLSQRETSPHSHLPVRTTTTATHSQPEAVKVTGERMLLPPPLGLRVSQTWSLSPTDLPCPDSFDRLLDCRAPEKTLCSGHE